MHGKKELFKNILVVFLQLVKLFYRTGTLDIGITIGNNLVSGHKPIDRGIEINVICELQLVTEIIQLYQVMMARPGINYEMLLVIIFPSVQLVLRDAPDFLPVRITKRGQALIQVRFFQRC